MYVAFVRDIFKSANISKRLTRNMEISVIRALQNRDRTCLCLARSLKCVSSPSKAGLGPSRRYNLRRFQGGPEPEAQADPVQWSHQLAWPVCGALLLCRGTAAPSLLPSSFATTSSISLNISRLWISRGCRFQSSSYENQNL